MRARAYWGSILLLLQKNRTEEKEAPQATLKHLIQIYTYIVIWAYVSPPIYRGTQRYTPEHDKCIEKTEEDVS